MHTAGRIFFSCAAVVLAVACSRFSRSDRELRRQLFELDGYVSAREVYLARKQDQMQALTRLARSTQDPLRRYELEMNIAQEFFAFSFDSTQVYLKHCQELAAGPLRNRDLYNQATIGLGHLYAKAGNYMEASQILYGQIDTAELTASQMAEYQWILYDFSKDLAGNSGVAEQLSIPPEASFRPRLYHVLPKDSERWRSVLRDDFIDHGQLESADSVNRLLLATVKPEDRPFAIYAFFQSEIQEHWGNQPARMEWLIKSAECDLINAVRDYASLTMVAQNILPLDVDRSFRYLRIAQEDALQYNAKLRPWQISRFLMEVEDAYANRQLRQNKVSVISSILLAILVAILSLGTWVLINRSRKLSRVRKELEESNNRLAIANQELSGLNRQISKADQVKEKYIIDFLEGLSAQVSMIRAEDNRFRNLLKQGKADQLLKELSISGRSEKAREEFYQTFDNTFLAMYPNFVEQFNALLKEEARFHLGKDEKLNTELRIFALIRLGVDDSKVIATMLDYSVSTIYNYKVSVKNAALGDRDTFEDRVKNIGK